MNALLIAAAPKIILHTLQPFYIVEIMTIYFVFFVTNSVAGTQKLIYWTQPIGLDHFQFLSEGLFGFSYQRTSSLKIILVNIKLFVPMISSQLWSASMWSELILNPPSDIFRGTKDIFTHLLLLSKAIYLTQLPDIYHCLSISLHIGHTRDSGLVLSLCASIEVSNAFGFLSVFQF